MKEGGAGSGNGSDSVNIKGWGELIQLTNLHWNVICWYE
jgi:hypothetical protein